MSEIDKRRRRFLIDIKRQSNEQYFRSRRQMLLNWHPPHPYQPFDQHLFHLAKLSHSENDLLRHIDYHVLIRQLEEAVDTGEFQKCRMAMIICGNMLLDELRLEEREAVAGLLIRLYREQGIINGDAAHVVATGMFAFAASLPLIAQEVAAEGETLMLDLVLEIVQRAIPESPSQQLEEQVLRAISGVERLLSDCESEIQADEHFRRNILFYNALLQLHPLLMPYNASHYIALRGSLLNIFQKLSRLLTLNTFPLVFEAQAFANFLLSETLAEVREDWEHKALASLANLLVDYEQVDCGVLMAALTRHRSRIEEFFRRLLRNDALVGDRLKLLKILISDEKFYRHLKDLYEEYWQNVADLCLEVLRSSIRWQQQGEAQTQAELENMRMAVQILMILQLLTEGGTVFANHILNQGGGQLFEHILQECGRQGEDNGEITMKIREGIEHLLGKMQWE